MSYDPSNADTYGGVATGGLTPAQQLAKQRQLQAAQAGQVAGQNTVEPTQPGTPAITGGPWDPNTATPGLTAPVYNGGAGGYDQYMQQLQQYADAGGLGKPYPGLPSLAGDTTTNQSPPVNTNGGIPPPTSGAGQIAPPQGLNGPSGQPLPTNATDWQSFINAFGQGMPSYTPGQLPSGQLYSQDALNAQSAQFGLLQKVLNNPDTLSEENVRQMQESQKEQALGSQKSQMQQLTDRYAAMGRSGSGQLDAANRRISDNTLSQILGSNRDIAVSAAQTNQASRNQALNTANSVLGQSEDPQKFALEQALAGEGLKQQSTADALQGKSLALQGALGSGGLSLQQYQGQLANNLNWYQAISGNNNFLQDLIARIGMNNAGAVNTTNNNL